MALRSSLIGAQGCVDCELTGVSLPLCQCSVKLCASLAGGAFFIRDEECDDPLFAINLPLGLSLCVLPGVWLAGGASGI